MKYLLQNSLLLVLGLCIFSCEKVPIAPDPNNIPGLPASTQNGANTLGFLLNGVPWTPDGNNSLTIDFDPGIDNGIFNVVAYRQMLNGTNDFFVIGIRDSLNFINVPMSYTIARTRLAAVIFNDKVFCRRSSDDTTNYSMGILTVSKLDKIARIIAGTFEATLFNPQCGDTIKITNGRFDMKF